MVELQVMQRAKRGDHRIHNAFGHLAALGIQNGGVGHQVADIAHQHQRAALDRQLAAIRRLVGAVGVQLAGEGLAALGNGLGQIALHQPQPVGIGQNLVFGIDGRDGIFAIHDR